MQKQDDQVEALWGCINSKPPALSCLPGPSELQVLCVIIHHPRRAWQGCERAENLFIEQRGHLGPYFGMWTQSTEGMNE